MRSDSRAELAGGMDAAVVNPWVSETDIESGAGAGTCIGTWRCGEAADDAAGDENLRARAAEVVALSGRAGGWWYCGRIGATESSGLWRVGADDEFDAAADTDAGEDKEEEEEAEDTAAAVAENREVIADAESAM